MDPFVSLDLDLAVAADELARLEPLLRRAFEVERFPHSLNVSSADSHLRVQFQTDPSPVSSKRTPSCADGSRRKSSTDWFDELGPDRVS